MNSKLRRIARLDVMINLINQSAAGTSNTRHFSEINQKSTLKEQLSQYQETCAKNDFIDTIALEKNLKEKEDLSC